MLENHYETLGISRDASEDEIKKAYRKIVLKYHPDKKPGNKVAEEMFLEATEAYKILKDPEERKKHDSQFSWAQPRTERKIKRQGSDLRVSIKVSRSDLIRGSERMLVIERKGKCQSCAGTGSIDRETKKCAWCNGTGLQGFSLALGERKKCRYCKGVGRVPSGIRCFKCKGVALAPEIIRRKIALNPFMSESIILPQLGNYCFGGEAGDLIIDLNITEDPNYKVRDLDVAGRIRISPAQAVLGDIIKLAVFGKELEIKVPPGTCNGQVIEIKNAGIIYDGKAGDFKAVIYINIPLILSNEEKELYQKLLQIEKETSWPKTLNF